MQCKSEKLSLFTSELVSFLEKEWVLDAFEYAKMTTRKDETMMESNFRLFFLLGCKANGVQEENNYMMEALYQVLLHADASNEL